MGAWIPYAQAFPSVENDIGGFAFMDASFKNVSEDKVGNENRLGPAFLR